jgi:hypothetical protein
VAEGSGTNYGIFGSARDGTTNYAGFFEGDVHISGTLTNPSDRKLKTNIVEMGSVSEKLLSLPVYTYEFKPEWVDAMHLPEGTEFGFMAHEMEAAFPSLVKEAVAPISSKTSGDQEATTEERFKSVNYIGLIPVLVKTVQEQQEVIQQQQALILSLEARMKALEEKMK